MVLRRSMRLGAVLVMALAVAACSSDSSTNPQADDMIEVDLSTYPDSGDPVPDGTVLADQWASIGILFDADPASVNPIVKYYGGGVGSLFFTPDVQHVTAVFSFVETGTMNPVDITAFEITPWFNPGESAELVGLDEGGTEVVSDTVVSGDIGSESKHITMSIQGTFRTVEWRTHGDPGIAAGDIAFEF